MMGVPPSSCLEDPSFQVEDHRPSHNVPLSKAPFLEVPSFQGVDPLYLEEVTCCVKVAPYQEVVRY